jgi:hypothetical protein
VLLGSLSYAPAAELKLAEEELESAPAEIDFAVGGAGRARGRRLGLSAVKEHRREASAT